MVRREVGDIPDFVVDNDPAVFDRVVLGDLLDGDERFFGHGARQLEIEKMVVKEGKLQRPTVTLGRVVDYLLPLECRQWSNELGHAFHHPAARFRVKRK